MNNRFNQLHENNRPTENDCAFSYMIPAFRRPNYLAILSIRNSFLRVNEGLNALIANVVCESSSSSQSGKAEIGGKSRSRMKHSSAYADKNHTEFGLSRTSMSSHHHLQRKGCSHVNTWSRTRLRLCATSMPYSQLRGTARVTLHGPRS